MAKLSKSGSVSSNPGILVSDVLAIPEYKNDYAFDSELIGSTNPNSNYILRLNLRVYLNKIMPSIVTNMMLRGIAAALGASPETNRTVGNFPDSNGTQRLIKDWQGTEWQDFVRNFRFQAHTWNRKFWLMPPDDFTLFDVDQGSNIIRPNISCEFSLQIAHMAMGAHRSINVVNLYSLDDRFRADGNRYSTKSLEPKATISDGAGIEVRSHVQYTIVHEIGHAIGLPHIGVAKSLPHCTLAMMYDKLMPQSSIPAFYRDGKNSDPCYGDQADFGDADNIMGYGDRFAPENARPWLDRLGHHFRFPVSVDTSKWKVSMTEVRPKNMPALNLRQVDRKLLDQFSHR